MATMESDGRGSLANLSKLASRPSVVAPQLRPPFLAGT
jgi:hypothetical protein